MNWLNNILLVYPAIPSNTYWSFQYTLRFIGKKTGLPPLGLITMAAMLPDRYNLKLIDMNVEPLKAKVTLCAVVCHPHTFCFGNGFLWVSNNTRMTGD